MPIQVPEVVFLVELDSIFPIGDSVFDPQVCRLPRCLVSSRVSVLTVVPVLQETVLKAQADYYRRQATLVQKTWRGFRSRLYVFNFAEWKGYLNFVAEQNDDLR